MMRRKERGPLGQQGRSLLRSGWVRLMAIVACAVVTVLATSRVTLPDASAATTYQFKYLGADGGAHMYEIASGKYKGEQAWCIEPGCPSDANTKSGTVTKICTVYPGNKGDDYTTETKKIHYSARQIHRMALAHYYLMTKGNFKKICAENGKTYGSKRALTAYVSYYLKRLRNSNYLKGNPLWDTKYMKAVAKKEEAWYNANYKKYWGRMIALHCKVGHQDRVILEAEPISIKVAIGTTATSDGKHEVLLASASKPVTITDKVSYTFTLSGATLPSTKTFTVRGTLMDKATKAPLKYDGDTYTSSATFKPSKNTGSVNVSFRNVPVDALKGKEVVVYEQLYGDLLNGTTYDSKKPVAKHEDINDANQIIKFKYYDIATTATDSETGTHNGAIGDDGKVSIVDTVKYYGLTPKTAYKLTGTLMDKATGKPLQVNGSAVTASKTFTPTAANGSETITFADIPAEFVGGKTVVAFETLSEGNKDVISHANIRDSAQTVRYQSFRTEALDSVTHTHFGNAGDAVTITDTISYAGLTAGRQYVFKGTLHDAETGDAIEANGTPVSSENEFTPEAANGELTVTFANIPGDVVAGKACVVYEELYQYPDTPATPETPTTPETPSTPETTPTTPETPEDQATSEGGEDQGQTTGESEGTDEGESGEATDPGQAEPVTRPEPTLIERHMDADDTDQTVWYPSIRTNASVLEAHSVSGAETTPGRLRDRVTYQGLAPGTAYVVQGTLHDKEGGAALQSEGKDIVVERTIRPTSQNGSCTLDFTVPAELAMSKTIVVYEKLILRGEGGDTVIATHEDINDESQTVVFPNIRTTAVAKASGTHYGQRKSASEPEVIVDHVEYVGLKPGTSYVMIGTLYDKTTGNPISVASGNGEAGEQPEQAEQAEKDGDGIITVEKEFVTQEASGSVDIEFTLPGNTVANGNGVVVFETLVTRETSEGTTTETTVTTHEDINDENQTVWFPNLDTTATDGETGDHVGDSFKETVTIVDMVEYEGLVANKEYTLRGTLRDKETGKELMDGDKPVTVEKKFTPTSTSGTERIEFKVPGSLVAGKSVVAFETVFLDEIEVVTHADINDDDQTVKFPSISTTATAKDTNTHYGSLADEVTIMDRVVYKGLDPAIRYAMVGTLNDKATGKVIENDGKAVSVEQVFEPTSPDGAIDMAFTVPGSLVAGKAVVVFEQLMIREEVPIVADGEVSTEGDSTGDSAGDEAEGNQGDASADDSDGNEGTGETGGNGESESDGGSGEESEGTDGAKVTVPVNIPVTSDIDINNESQTVRFVEIGTVAVDKETNTHYTDPKSSVTIVDTVTYKGLKVGTQYTMVGTLMNKSNSQPIKGTDGRPVTKSVNFTPTSTDGSMKIEFQVPGSVVAHSSIVTFERCMEGDVLVASHEDINDQDQTVRYSDLASDLIQLGVKFATGAVVIGAVAMIAYQIARRMRRVA